MWSDASVLLMPASVYSFTSARMSFSDKAAIFSAICSAMLSDLLHEQFHLSC